MRDKSISKLAARDGLEVFPCTTITEAELESAIVGKRENSALAYPDAIISALNSDSPRTQPLFMAGVISRVLTAMATYNIKKLTVLSAFGVGSSYPYTGLLLHNILHATNLLHTYVDHEAVEFALEHFELAALVVRSVMHSEGEKSEVFSYEASGKNSGTLISRQSLGAFLVDSVQPEWPERRSTIVVSN